MLSGQRKAVARNGIGWQGILLAAIVFLHFAMLAYVASWQAVRHDSMLVPDDTLQVSFIERISSSETRQSKSDRKTNNKALLGTRISAASPNADWPAGKDSDETMPGAALRLTIERDEWQADTIIAPRDPLKRQYIAIAGRAEPFIQGIKLTGTLSPKQRLEKVGMLFGAVSYDPCEEARKRMANGGSQANDLDVEVDLRAIELNCRP